eukprot:TRINITY_DN768_c0_g1_i3.p1 TRINITY_DN768_c0_g1~~TRINITY_DN768_c0_g1_i3.p1  ORF type:complete len:770 (+),score=173.96 TRINITY_DN768_c0_g1_i3:391-2700(+)
MSCQVTTIFSIVGVSGWPGLLEGLCGILDRPDYESVHGAFSILSKICEDSCETLDSEYSRPLNFMIPKFIQFFAHPNADIVRMALHCVNQFVLLMPNALTVSMSQFIAGLMSIAQSQHAEIRKRVCSALVMLADVRMEHLMPMIASVVEYLLIATQDEDDGVALEACEFWQTICTSDVAKELLTAYLPRVVPVLLNAMVYSDMEIAVLDTPEVDEHVPDRQSDIAPRFHHSHVKQYHEQQSDSSDEEEDDEDESDEETTEWSLRKAAAAGLDCIASTFKDRLLPVLLPLMNANLNSQEWKVREAGILALGAISEGCMEALDPYLNEFIGFTIALLNDPKALVRSIACWSLSRYSDWIATQPQKLAPAMHGLLQRLLDRNKKVQEAAISSFATLEESAQVALVPYIKPILENLMFAFTKYQAKNLLILYDAVGALAEAVGENLNQPEYVQLLLPSLVAKWNVVRDDDRSLLPLLECLTAVVQALGPGFATFAAPVFDRALRLIHGTLVALSQGDDEWRDFMICSLDLLSGMMEGIGSGMEPAIQGSQLLVYLAQCARDSDNDVRQSTFALIGDLAKSCMETLRPALPDFIPILASHLVPVHVSVCNNASWALGEIAIRLGEGMADYAPAILSSLITLMTTPRLNTSLKDNIAITIGRLGMVVPAIAAPHLQVFLQAWCSTLRDMRDDDEKDSAFRGMCMMIKFNPAGAVPAFIYVCDAMASWQIETLKPDLLDSFRQILHTFKGAISTWDEYYGSFPEELREKLSRVYGI